MNIERLNQLKKGQVVKLNDGSYGRYRDGYLETSTGEKLNLPEEERLMISPKDQDEAEIADYMERTERSLGEKGSVGRWFEEAGHQLSETGLVKGLIKKPVQFLQAVGENWLKENRATGEPSSAWRSYENKRKASEIISRMISEESPGANILGSGVGFAADVGSVYRLPGAVGGAILGAGSMGPDIVSNPEGAVKEALIGGAIGGGTDLIFKGLSKLAGARGARAEIHANTMRKNFQDAEAHTILAGDIQANNALKLQKHEEEMANWIRKADETKAEIQRIKAEYNGEISRLDNEYKEAVNQHNFSKTSKKNKAEMRRIERDNKIAEYEKKLADFERNKEVKLRQIDLLRKNAKQEYLKTVEKAGNDLSDLFPGDAKVMGDAIEADAFLGSAFDNTPFALTTAGGKFKKMVKNLFGGKKAFSPKELGTKYRTMEEFVLDHPEAKDMMMAFKGHLNEKLPQMIADSRFYNRVVPNLYDAIVEDFSTALKNEGFKKSGLGGIDIMIGRAKDRINDIIGSITPTNFTKKFFDLKEAIKENVVALEDMGKLPGEAKATKQAIVTRKEIQKAILDHKIEAFDRISFEFGNLIDQRFIPFEREFEKAVEEARNLTQQITGKIPAGPKTIKEPAFKEPKFKEPTQPPAFEAYPPEKPTYPPEPSLPPLPTKPIKPGLERVPPAPKPAEVPGPGNNLERLADSLNNIGGKLSGAAASDPWKAMGALSLLQHFVPGGAIGAAGAAGAIKAASSPGVSGGILRHGMRGGVLASVDTMLSKYPSYQNGVIQDPMERRAATREIEDNPEMSLSDKAVLQAKINKGISITNRL